MRMIVPAPLGIWLSVSFIYFISASVLNGIKKTLRSPVWPSSSHSFPPFPVRNTPGTPSLSTHHVWPARPNPPPSLPTASFQTEK